MTLAAALRADRGQALPGDQPLPRACAERLACTGIEARRAGVLVRSRISDGSNRRRRSGDFDFYRLRVTRGKAVTVDTSRNTSDAMVAVYDRYGRIRAANDDARRDLTSLVRYEVPRTGYYFVMVSGYGRGLVPSNPFRPGSGVGAGERAATGSGSPRSRGIGNATDSGWTVATS